MAFVQLNGVFCYRACPKGDLTKADNYRGRSLSQISGKIYNRLILNRLRPEVDKMPKPKRIS